MRGKSQALCAFFLAAALVLFLFSGCSKREKTAAGNPQGSGAETASAGGTLTIFTWAEMFPPEVLKSFEKDTGYKINMVNFDENETMLTKLETSGGSGYDLIIADDYIIETVIEKGLAQKLKPDKIPNFGNINPVYQSQFYDPSNEYTIPYGAGVQTIVYNPGIVNINIQGFTELWDPRLKNNLAVVANPRVVTGMALKTLGYSYNTEDVGAIREAGSILLSLAPNIRLIRDDKLDDEILSGEVAAALMYTSDATNAKIENPGLKVVFPREGVGFGIMAGFIPSRAANEEAAHAFFTYILDPQRGAQCFEFLGYYSTYAASDNLISEKYREFLTLPEGIGEMEMMDNISPEAEEAHSIVWTAFKAAAGHK
ncbi:MAG: spermidine/putrescine ABC transporter substrate-binding protein [Spirochaetales bacterium]|nr:spermidine/putrescine ABC transporter substrate-binding protein [Spirochaetales bacterium]